MKKCLIALRGEAMPCWLMAVTVCMQPAAASEPLTVGRHMALAHSTAGPPEKQTSLPPQKHRPRTISPDMRLVPPPPPVIPLLNPWSSYGALDPTAMSPQEIKAHLTELSSQLVSLGQAEQDKENASKEMRQRAKLFESLYKEGVISRRELEGSHRDADSADRDASEAKAKVAGLQNDLGRLNQALKRLNAPRAKRRGDHRTLDSKRVNPSNKR